MIPLTLTLLVGEGRGCDTPLFTGGEAQHTVLGMGANTGYWEWALTQGTWRECDLTQGTGGVA